MTGSNSILAIVVGAIVVIVAFSLWPVLNASSNQLYSYFRDSCVDGIGNRFLRGYVEHTGANPAGNTAYSIQYGHGGAGIRLAASGRDCSFTGEHLNADDVLFNEYGNHIFTAAAAVDASTVQALPYEWIEVADILKRFSGINKLLLTIIPVISIAGFLGISGAKLYSYGKGASNIGSALTTSIITLVAIVIALVIAGPVIGSLVEANLVVESGQYQINSVFGNIVTLLFAMIPIIYIAGLVTLVGLQAKSPLMGGRLP